MSKSKLEEELLYQIRAVGLPEPESEYRFYDKRRWRADFAWPLHKVLVEVEGGIWVRGRHTRGSGFEKDCEKHNKAVELGWQVYRFTGKMIDEGNALQVLLKVLGSKLE